MFSAYFPGFLRVRKARKILGVFEVCLGIFKKTKEKKDGESFGRFRFSFPVHFLCLPGSSSKTFLFPGHSGSQIPSKLRKITLRALLRNKLERGYYNRVTLSGEKSAFTTAVAPLLSWSVAQPQGHRAKKAMAHTISLGKQLWCIPFWGKTREKGTHHRSGKRMHHRGPRP